MEERKIKFSFIMPVYNDGSTVERAVESILDQDVKDVEVILVNDGSSDDSKMRIGYLATMHPDKVRAINFDKNQGACAARNAGAKEAKGEYLAWLPADAKLYPGALRIWMDALDENPGKDFMYGGYRVTDEQFNPVQNGDFLFEDFDPYLLEVTNYIDGSFPMRRTTYDRVLKEIQEKNPKADGLWDSEVKSLQDWDFWLTVVKHGGKGLWIRDIFFETTMPHKGGLSDDSANNWLDRTDFIKKKHGIPDRKVCVASLGAGWHARNIAKMLNADFKEMPSFKPNRYECIYVIGFYPEFATTQDQMFWNVVYDQSKGRTPAKKIVHFVGSDVWQLYHVSTMSLKVWREYFKNNADILLCESEFIKKELEELGINDVRVVPIPPAKIYEAMPLPEKFTVAVYQPAVNADFYKPKEMEEIAKYCPDIEFKFFGNPMRKGRRKDEAGKDLNIEDMGYIAPEDMGKFIADCSAIFRMPNHDGLPLSVIEFLTAGRYSIQSVPIEHTICLPISTFTVEKGVEALNMIKGKKESNIEGSKFWREKASHETYVKTMNELCQYQPKDYWERRAQDWTRQAATQAIEKDEVKGAYIEALSLMNIAMPSVLDIGCGDGRWLPHLQEWGMSNYVGIDISERLIEAAKLRFPHNLFHAMKVEDIGDFEQKDLIFSYTCLEHITGEEFPKAVEAIKKAGKFLLLIEPTDFPSRHYCHNHDYAKHFSVMKEWQLKDKKIMLCKLH